MLNTDTKVVLPPLPIPKDHDEDEFQMVSANELRALGFGTPGSAHG